jgi:hypothetical protein
MNKIGKNCEDNALRPKMARFRRNNFVFFVFVHLTFKRCERRNYQLFKSIIATSSGLPLQFNISTTRGEFGLDAQMLEMPEWRQASLGPFQAIPLHIRQMLIF